ncbi:MAG: phospholipase D-like domain-containing protein, partial [Deltaproteobacteria bacterium]|nr:phospholipase D-like domain-containing protein [Deltaproteobacteria bacterium]
GSYRLPRQRLEALVRAGGRVAWFNPVRGVRWRFANFRTHRKILIIDGMHAFTGGMNISAKQAKSFSRELAWRDTHLGLSGPVVRVLQRIFFEDWYFASGELIPAKPEFFIKPTCPEGGILVQIIGSGPDRDLSPIHAFLCSAIGQAKERIWLTTPYFVPDEAALSALLNAGLRGVDVRVILPKSSDSRLVDLAARSYFPDLVRGRIRFFEYQPRFIHAKSVVIDRELAIIGTANFDNRSFRLNFEVMAVVYDEGVNSELGKAFLMDLQNSKEVRAHQVYRKGILTRLGENGARLFSPLL